MALYYPSILGREINSQLSLNFADYFGDINYGTAAFNRSFYRAGHFSLAVNYISYGSFTEADELGNRYGNFSAGEYAVVLGWGRQLTEKISIGSNLKSIFSYFEEYSSTGLAADVSVSWFDSDRMIATSLVVRNIGRQITTYNSTRENIPFDIVLGISKKLINAPLRFSMVAHNLHRPDLTYPDFVNPDQITLATETPTNPARDRIGQFTDKLFRHLVFGIEFTPTANLSANIGYNYRRRQEMMVSSRPSSVGLSFGLGLKVSHFRFYYGRANYHLAGSPNHISITTNMETLFVRPGTKPSIRTEQ